MQSECITIISWRQPCQSLVKIILQPHFNITHILHYTYSEREIQEIPHEPGKSMKYSRSTFGRKTCAQPIPFITVKKKYIFLTQFKISCVFFHNLTKPSRKHTAPLIHLACPSQGTQTHMSEKAYSLMIKAKELGIKPPGLFYRKKI